MNILLTGGMGFIGSHTAVELLQAGHHVVIYDNLCNASLHVLDKIQQITHQSPKFILGDIRNTQLLQQTLSDNHIDAVIHFAGLKAVGESVQKPIEYYDNNVVGTVSLLQAMKACQIYNLIFSSSATVYGLPPTMPITEEMPRGACTNPYGRTKAQIEEILEDVSRSDEHWHFISLRYFNPIGAHPSGLIGDAPTGIPNNLMPYLSRVASGRLKYLQIFGNDYPTVDGTGVRDYIHVVDLAKGHVCALNYLQHHAGMTPINLGCGIGTSVLELVHAFERVTGVRVPYEITDRRPGDLAQYWCSPEKAHRLLQWKAQYTIDDMCAHSWNFEQKFKNEN